jgi:hypothetical protein
MPTFKIFHDIHYVGIYLRDLYLCLFNNAVIRTDYGAHSTERCYVYKDHLRSLRQRKQRKFQRSGNVTSMGETRDKCIQNFYGEPPRETTSWRSKRILECKIKADIRYISYEDGKWMKLARVRVQCWAFLLVMPEPSSSANVVLLRRQASTLTSRQHQMASISDLRRFIALGDPVYELRTN